jgi:hypothetical protein
MVSMMCWIDWMCVVHRICQGVCYVDAGVGVASGPCRLEMEE